MDPYLLFENFKKKNNFNFQNIKLIFNSIFYKESKEFTFARISRKKLLFETSVWREDDTKGGPLSTVLRISREKKILIFKILNSFLIVYFIKSPKSLHSQKYLERNYFLNTLFEGKMIQWEDPYLPNWEFQEEKNYNFQNIKLIFNSMFYKESKEFTFGSNISKKITFWTPCLKGRWYKGGTLIYFFENFKRQNLLIF